MWVSIKSSEVACMYFSNGRYLHITCLKIKYGEKHLGVRIDSKEKEADPNMLYNSCIRISQILAQVNFDVRKGLQMKNDMIISIFKYDGKGSNLELHNQRCLQMRSKYVNQASETLLFQNQRHELHIEDLEEHSCLICRDEL